MTGLLNGGFEDWNFGTVFNPPTINQQLADNWYAGTGGEQVLQDSTHQHSGSFSLFLSGAGSGFIYQDIFNYLDYKGTNTIFSVWLLANGLVAGATIVIDDGISTTSLECPVINSYQQFSVNQLISNSATKLRVSILSIAPDLMDTFSGYIDDASLSSISGFSRKFASTNLIF